MHSLVASYVQDQFDEKTCYEAHEKAAWYYQQRVKIYCQSFGNRHHISDVYLIIEAIWQFCQAKQWEQAYNVMDQERIFVTLKRCGANASLFELLQLLLPLDKWHASPSQAAYVHTYLGDVYRTLGQRIQAREHLEQAKSICENNTSHGIAENLPYNWVLNNLGRYYSTVDDWKRAKSVLSKH